jgi:uncharacterized protein YneF (UPF0154 family)
MKHHHYRHDIWRSIRLLVVLALLAGATWGAWFVSAGIRPQGP